MGFAVEAAFCQRIISPQSPSTLTTFQFLRCGIGFRSVSFDTFEITGSGSASVDDSLNSVYFMFSADQRF